MSQIETSSYIYMNGIDFYVDTSIWEKNLLSKLGRERNYISRDNIELVLNTLNTGSCDN